jgi:spoIIIJ-associated protein
MEAGVALEAAMEKARGVLVEILGKMGLDASVDASENDERITLDIKGPDAGLVIGKKGQTLDAIQYLCAKVTYRGQEGQPDSTKPIQVDTEGYRARRAEALVEMANRLAEKVTRTQRPVEVDPMSAGDRRIIHMALATVAGVATRSEGEGQDRRLVIFPAPDKA